MTDRISVFAPPSPPPFPQAPPMSAPAPVVLMNAHVRLEPLEASHAEAIYAAGQDDRIWAHKLRGPLTSLADAHGYVAEALAERAAGRQLPFVIRAAGSGALLGLTRYLDLQVAHGGLEIGHTWLVPTCWRTAVNTAAKRLLLAHAFEDLSASRVCLKTDILNERSQRAIERLGARREGVLRAHRRRPDGSLRDTVYYAVLAAEWPVVRSRLDALLG